MFQRINFYRKMQGLDACTNDAALSVLAQEAALMMDANNTLNHTPPTSWTCYTNAGAAAAGKSNLALGFNGSAAIDGYMNDNGLKAVGHRRWVIYSRAKTFGNGTTNSANALYALHNSSNTQPTKLPEFLAYPPKGYIVSDLASQVDEWSFGLPLTTTGGSVSFANANVSMKNETGTTVTLVKEAVQNGFGDNTLVWTPAISKTYTKDTKYTVTVSNVVVGTATKSFTYDVNIVKR